LSFLAWFCRSLGLEHYKHCESYVVCPQRWLVALFHIFSWWEGTKSSKSSANMWVGTYVVGGYLWNLKTIWQLLFYSWHYHKRFFKHLVSLWNDFSRLKIQANSLLIQIN
jgi:hypothetical protein